VPETIVVAAAVISRDGRYLVTRRLEGTHLEGLWEFPGGKIEPGESHEDCLRREIREELGTSLAVGAPLLSTRHDYGVKLVELHFFDCVLEGEPKALLGQQVRWVSRAELRSLEFPAADAALIDYLAADRSDVRHG
jgi:8-oxo-dGTP diphosphatase